MDGAGPPFEVGGSGGLESLAASPLSLRAAVSLSVLGHHSGLSDRSEAESELEYVSTTQREDLDRLLDILQEFTESDAPRMVWNRSSPFRQEFAARFVFSSLIEADRWDTARFYERAPEGRAPPLEELWGRLERNQAELMAGLSGQARESSVNHVRREVYEACLRAAIGPPGIYRLTVPTGGGKTRSSLAFALRHAVVHGKRGVIYAIPFTSIIDQTALVFREILGHEAVLEFHSQVADPPPGDHNFTSDEVEMDPIELRKRLEEENWDHPLIVTTTVQLFESLLASHPSRARKIRNIARSVIVLDEVQALPTELLDPTLDVLQTLVDEYGVTVLLCTATQPAFEKTPFGQRLRGTEINTNSSIHFARLKRVSYRWHSTAVDWKQVARWVAEEPQGLAIVNSRAGAVTLAQDVLERVSDPEGVFHLSTLLCGAHRRDVLSKVRVRLRAGQEVRLVSTQVVEAGVDLDFPVVWRALAPLDRVVQAAGRCNREGTGAAPGQVHLFVPSGESMPTGSYRSGAGRTRSLLESNPCAADSLEDPIFMGRYFESLYRDLALENGFDKLEIQPLREAWAFRQVGQRYRLIPDDTVPVIVDYPVAEHQGKGPAMARRWSEMPSRDTWRRLQSYTVNIRRKDLEGETARGAVDLISEGLGIWQGGYDLRFGLPLALRDPVDPSA